MVAASPQELRNRLWEYFGFRRFRPGQLEAVRAALEGRDTLVVMPTGSGKSLCYQLPGLEIGGMTVVVSPLIALMKDQADHLRQRGIDAVGVNSSLSAAEHRHAEEAIAAGRADFVFATPERMAVPEFRDLLRKRSVDLFVVDEAHCVSRWGHDFRPDYLTLGEAVEYLGRPTVLALTATATPDVVDDVLVRLRMPDAEVVHTGFYRPNIGLSVTRVEGEADKNAQLLRLLKRLDGSGIVYTATVKAVDELTAFLAERGVAAAGYHGKMAAKRRCEAQDQFMSGQTRVMVATNAFGLGIDKPDIRFVLHYHIPGSLEDYYQEVGRAGRDDLPARGTLLYDPEDLKLQRFFQGRRYPDEGDLVNAYHALQRLADRPDPLALEDVKAIAPLAEARLKVCLNLLVERGIVHHEGDGYRLVLPDLSRDDVARAGESYRERHERDLLKQRRLVDYAEEPGCRWHRLLDYFGGEELPGGRCGHCDHCDPQAFA